MRLVELRRWRIVELREVELMRHELSLNLHSVRTLHSKRTLHSGRTLHSRQSIDHDWIVELLVLRHLLCDNFMLQALVVAILVISNSVNGGY